MECCGAQKNENKESQGCGCSAPEATEKTSCCTSDLPPWVLGLYETKAGNIPKISSKWCRADYLGMIKSRSTAFRMDYAVPPGIYALGSPDENSDIFVSANYKLSFDVLRKALDGLSAWILVIDTKGINVWCAAGKGTFGTDELIGRIKTHKLDMLVTHRRIITPQLGAPGIDADAIQKETGFRVSYGPVRASDIKAYIAADYKATKEMRSVKFGLLDRLILTPIELNPAFKALPLLALAILLIAGIQPQGILYQSILKDGLPMLVMFIFSILSGAFLTPVFLPFIPFRSFAAKGWLLGTLITGLSFAYLPYFRPANIFYAVFGLLVFPAFSSYLALQFTGATTFTSISGVKKEIRYSMPVYKAAIVVSVLMFAAYKIKLWGII
jgi:hypothetical protein